MKERLLKKIMRTACIVVACFSLVTFSGCDAIFSYLDALLSSDKSTEDSAYQDSDSSTSSAQFDSSTSSSESSSEEDSSSTSSAETSQDERLDFSIIPIEEKYGYQYVSTQTNGVNLQKFYKDLYNLCVTFSTSTKNIPSKTINYQDNTSATVYIIGDVNFGKYGLTQKEVITVWAVAMAECPAFYWMAHSASYTETSLNVYIDKEYATYAERQRVARGLKERANECWAYISKNATDTEKALSIADYIMANMEYSYESDGKTPRDDCWAHNVEGIVLGQGVCESYAKTYDYFCELMGLDCLTVTGMAGTNGNMGGHAWNTVQIDGVWYDVDLTWEDNETSNRAWIGVPSTEFDTTHEENSPYNGHGETWLYALPTRSTSKLQPVSVSESGGEETYYPNLDTAFASLQNSQSEYTINVCPSTKSAIGEGFTIDPYEVSFTTTTLPQTKKLTLLGKNVSLLNQSVIIAKNTISINSPIVVENCTLQYYRRSSGTSYITTLGSGKTEMRYF